MNAYTALSLFLSTTEFFQFFGRSLLAPKFIGKYFSNRRSRLLSSNIRANEAVGCSTRSKVAAPFLSPFVPNEGGGPSIFTRPTRFHLNPSDGEREGQDPRNRERRALSNSILPERTVRLDYTGRDIHPCRGRKPQTWHDLGPLPLGGWGNFEIEFPDYLRSLPLGGGFPATK